VRIRSPSVCPSINVGYLGFRSHAAAVPKWRFSLDADYEGRSLEDQFAEVNALPPPPGAWHSTSTSNAHHPEITRSETTGVEGKNDSAEGGCIAKVDLSLWPAPT